MKHKIVYTKAIGAMVRNFALAWSLTGCAATGQDGAKPASSPSDLAGSYTGQARAAKGSAERVSSFAARQVSRMWLNLKKDGKYILFTLSEVQGEEPTTIVKGAWSTAGGTVTLTPAKDFKPTSIHSLLNYEMTKKLTLKVIAQDLRCFGPRTSDTDATTIETWFVKDKGKP